MIAFSRSARAFPRSFQRLNLTRRFPAVSSRSKASRRGADATLGGDGEPKSRAACRQVRLHARSIFLTKSAGPAGRCNTRLT